MLFVPAAGHIDELKQIEPVLLRLEELGIVTRLVVNFLPRSLSQVSFEEFGGIPLLTFSTAPRDELLLFVRRCVDVTFASALLVLLSPLMGAIALLVKATSPGPVLFRQQRCGLHGRPFTFLKFRSMQRRRRRPEARRWRRSTRWTGPAFKMTNDPRVTTVGRALRRTSLDELPQLWNILQGRHELRRPAAGGDRGSASVRAVAAAAALDAARAHLPLAGQRPQPADVSTSGCDWISSTSTTGRCGWT